MSTQWEQLFRSFAREPASCRYCIAFTPRSGSSWLENLLTRSGIFGIPQEWFNPKAARNTVRRSGTEDLPAYYDYLKKVMRTGEVFGVEMTWPHANMVFQSGHPTLFDDMQTWFFLRRTDFVAQGVSLYKAEQTGRFHSVQEDRAGRPVDYDGEAISGCIARIMSNEFGLQLFFRERQLSPVHLWHEELVSSSKEDLVRLFVDALKLPAEAYYKVHFATLESQHKKIGDAESEAMIRRFRAENPLYVQYWDEHRGLRSIDRFAKEYEGEAARD